MAWRSTFSQRWLAGSEPRGARKEPAIRKFRALLSRPAPYPLRSDQVTRAAWRAHHGAHILAIISHGNLPCGVTRSHLAPPRPAEATLRCKACPAQPCPATPRQEAGHSGFAALFLVLAVDRWRDGAGRVYCVIPRPSPSCLTDSLGEGRKGTLGLFERQPNSRSPIKTERGRLPLLLPSARLGQVSIGKWGVEGTSHLLGRV